MSDTLTALQVRVGERRYALPLDGVQRVLRAVEVTPVPGAGDMVLGVVNVHGRLCPVFDVRRRFQGAERPVSPSDWLVLARAARRDVLLLVDEADGVIEIPRRDVADTAALAIDGRLCPGAAVLGSDVVLIHDLDAFLSPGERRQMEAALDASPTEAG